MLKFLFPKTAIQWLGPVIALGLAAAVVALVVIETGILDLGASTPHPQGWAITLHHMFKRSTHSHSRGLTAPASLDAPRQIRKGAAYFDRVCARCHATPGRGQNPVALSMRPRPQYLPNVVGEFDDRELFWIVKHGVKYSAMPSWPAQTRDDEVWSVVSFVRKLPGMSKEAYDRLTEGAAGRTPTADDAGWPAAFAQAAQDFEGPNNVSFVVNPLDQPDDATYAYRAPASGFDHIQTGGNPVAACGTCHGAQGEGSAGGAFPNIAMQTDTYIKDALSAFQTGKRKSGYMQTIAAQLSPQDIDVLSRYYAALPPRKSQVGNVPQRIVSFGEKIGQQGIIKRKIPSCHSCHRHDESTDKLMPRLNGQYAGYIADQLRLFKGKGRGSTTSYNPMTAVSHNLTEPEIVAVSAYYAAQAPVSGTGLIAR